MKRISASLLLCIALCSASTARTTPTDKSVIELAKTAILDVPFDRIAAISVETTNGLKKVVFPRDWNCGAHSTTPAQSAATVFVDTETGLVVPNPELPFLSDEQAVCIATNAVPIPFDHSKTVRVDRASSVIRVTLPDKDREIAPGVVFTEAPLVWIWIDGESQSVLWARMEAN
ncbi:MAG: hypothetical protein IJV65_09870 [Kiritimatiellae bacterium]|nr:hypothetical protein [Kiritimatiellia bacterium]